MILVTGATGLVGARLCARLQQDGRNYRVVVRGARAVRGADTFTVDDLATADWRDALSGVRTVIHLAARAHTFGRGPAESVAYERTNVLATERLVRAAAIARVERVVHLSSAKVHGEESRSAFRESDSPAPRGAYAESKWRAEQIVSAVGRSTGTATVIIRSPLVYGPGVRANFLSLLEAVNRGVPLPFGAVRNCRSMIFVDNLVDALVRVADDPRAQNEVFLVKDQHDLSTPDLIRRLAVALGRAPRLVAIPVPVLRAVATVLGRRASLAKIIGSFVVDATRIRDRIGWAAPYPSELGFAATAAWYRDRAMTADA